MADVTGAGPLGPVTAITDNVIYFDPNAHPSRPTLDQAVRDAAFYAASIADLIKQLAAEMEQFSKASQRQAELEGLVASTRDYVIGINRLSQTIARLPQDIDGAS